jgi:hypothetical protein
MRLLIPLGCLLSFACSPKPSGSAPEVTQRQRDSVLGESRLPGAQGIRGALRVSDSASAHRARLDSVEDQP